MRSHFLYLVYLPLQLVRGQLKDCYAWDGTPTTDFPCNPEANVSSCCVSNGRCATNLYIFSPPAGVQMVGTCTDKSWADPACPFKLNLGNVTDNFDHFSYQLNVTICSDSTVCPNPRNQSCCDQGQGRTEINYHNNAIMPSALADLSSYYALGGFTIPVSTSSSTRSTSLSTPTPSSPLAVSIVTISSSPTSLPSPKASSSGLSPGAKTGVGVGTGVGLAILGVLLWILYMLYRRRNTQSPADEQNILPPTPGSSSAIGELCAEAKAAEMSAEAKAAEMSAEAKAAEMQENYGRTNVHNAQELSGFSV